MNLTTLSRVPSFEIVRKASWEMGSSTRMGKGMFRIYRYRHVLQLLIDQVEICKLSVLVQRTYADETCQPFEADSGSIAISPGRSSTRPTSPPRSLLLTLQPPSPISPSLTVQHQGRPRPLTYRTALAVWHSIWR